MTTGRLQDKVAIVTGSTKGIGEAIALGYGREGAKVVVTGRSAERGAAVVDVIKADGGEAHFIQFDLGEEQSCKDLIAAAVDHYGRVDIVVNNAHPTEHTAGGEGGLEAKLDQAIGDIDTDAWRKVTAPTFDGLFWMLRESIKQMQKQGGGTLINISSMVSQQGLAGVDIHTATKGAMNALTRSIAVEYGPEIRCNCIVVGMVMTAATAPLANDPVIGPKLAEIVLTGRLGLPEDFIGPAVFLANEEESFFVSGQCIAVDGGMSIKMLVPKLEAAPAE